MPIAAPTGRVVLVFTDVQGSTSLWDRCPVIMRDALEVHDRLMRDAIERFGGYEVKTEGDAFMIAFARPDLAATWCIAVQEALVAAPWPEELLVHAEAAEETNEHGTLWRGLRVRMGAHEGQPHCTENPITGRMDYFGPMVNRAARVSAAGHGGQILLSDAMTSRLDAQAWTLVDLDVHRLKGLGEPERIWQLASPGLAARQFAPIRTEAARRSNVSRPSASMVGRDSALRDLDRMVRSHQVTAVVGPPGVGKTRLAHEVAYRLTQQSESLVSEVWMCGLEDAASVAEVCREVAAVVAPNQSLSQRDSVTQLGRILAARGRALLVLDGAERVGNELEHLVVDWISDAPALRIVLTSRDRLRIAGLVTLDLGGLGASDAAALFVERARGASDAMDPSVQELVTRLDGLPLAIELAAGRANVLGPAQLLERMDARGIADFGGLAAELDSAWAELPERDRACLARCAVFHQGFDLEAIGAILDSKSDPVDALQRLLDRSLLASRTTTDGRVRFHLLESVRTYARGKLQEIDPDDRAVDAWADYMSRLGERLGAEVGGHRTREALARLRIEQANQLAVVRTASLDVVTRLRAGLAADTQLAAHGPMDVRRRLLEELDRLGPLGTVDTLALAIAQIQSARESGSLDRARAIIARIHALQLTSSADVPPRLRARYDCLAGAVARTRGDTRDAEELIGSAIAIAEAHRLTREHALGLDARAALRQEQSDLRRAAQDIRKAIELIASLGDLREEARLRHNLGTILQDAGDVHGARQCYLAAIELAGEIDDERLIGLARANLGNLSIDAGDLGTARSNLLEALDRVRRAGDMRFEGHTNMYLGIHALLSGDGLAARQHLETALELERASETHRFAGLCRGYLAVQMILHGPRALAADLLDAAVADLLKVGDRHMAGYFVAIAARTFDPRRADQARALVSDAVSEWLAPAVAGLLGDGPLPGGTNQHLALARRLAP